MKHIIIEFQGYSKVTPDCVSFQHCETDEIIDGTVWVELDPEEQDNYDPVDAMDVVESSDSYNITDLNVFSEL